MKNNIIFHTECDYKIKNPSIVSGWLIKSAKSESRVIGNVNYIFCNDDYLLKKNQKYLQHDALTDIIAFDYSEENILNGDIYISVERIKENAVIFTVPFEEELNRVIIHGLLHLMGFKDKTKGEAKTMREKENFYLSRF